MYKSIIFAAVSVLFLSVPVASLPFSQPLDKRTYNGRGTWFNDGLGACGYTDGPSVPLVALSYLIYNSGAHCNQWVTVTNTETGQTASGQVRDECMSCDAGDLDMSTGLFQNIGNLNTGVLQISWSFDS